MTKNIVLCIIALALLGGCGQKASTRGGSAVSPAPVMSGGGGMRRHGRHGGHAYGGAMPSASLAPIPSSVDCGGSQPVWVNDRTKVYHVAGDVYYGRTKHGRYLCQRDARREGYREAASASR